MNARLSAALALAALLSSPAAAPAGEGEPAPPPAPAAGPAEDVLVFKSGAELRGRITAEDRDAYAVKVGGTLRVVDKADLREVRRAAPAPGDPGREPPPGAGEEGEGDWDGPGDSPKGKERPGRKRDRRKGGEAEGGPAGEGREPGGGMEEAGRSAPPPLSDEARAWASSCVERLLAAADPAVRRSALEGIRALGPGVRPVLEEARAASKDPAAQAVLARVADSLDAPRPGPVPPPGKDGAGKDPPPRARADRGRGLLDRVRTELGLDAEGVRTLGGKLIAYGREFRTLMEDARDGLITFEEARTRGSDLRVALRDSLKDLLTADQQAKLDAMLDDLAPGRKR